MQRALSAILGLSAAALAGPTTAATSCAQCGGSACELTDTDLDPLDRSLDDLVLLVRTASASFAVGRALDADPTRGAMREVSSQLETLA